MRKLTLVLLLMVRAFAQPQPAFEAASVRALGDKSGESPVGMTTRGGPGSSDPERLTYKKVVFGALLTKAYGATRLTIEGPAWIWQLQDAYDVEAKIPPGTTEEQFKLMFQNLLKERFDLKVHHESRKVPGYELTIAKNGPKFKDIDPDSPPRPPIPPTRGADGVMQAPSIPTGRITAIVGPGHIAVNRQPVSVLVSHLWNQLERPVIDRTGLTGVYDWVLDYSPEGLGGFPGIARPPGPDSSAIPPDPKPSVFDALQEQLGLKLEKATVPLDVLVVDSANRAPSEN